MERYSILDQLSSEKVDIIYSTLIYIGKNHLKEFKDNVVQFLDHPEPELRSAAIRVWGFYWKLPEYEAVSLKVMKADIDSEVRMIALMAWACYYTKTNNKKVMEVLYEIAQNKGEESYIREQAYQGILVVSPLEPPDWPTTMMDDLDKEADWNLIEKLVKE